MSRFFAGTRCFRRIKRIQSFKKFDKKTSSNERGLRHDHFKRFGVTPTGIEPVLPP